MIHERIYFALFVFCFNDKALAWTSAKVYPSGTGLAYAVDAEGNRVPDFGYAGYEEGCMPIPTGIPVVMTLTPVAGDNTANINNALAAVAAMPVQANGYRGALLLKPGTYGIAGVVRLGGDGVVLRGSGSGTNAAVDSILFSTRTDFDATSLRGEYSVVILGNIPYSNNGLRGVGTAVNITTPWVKVGDDSFQVADVAPFAAGDIIVINQPITDAWLATINYGDTAGAPNWTAGGSIVQERRITAIDAATKTIHIAGGSFQHLKLALGQCSIAKMDPARFARHSGIEDLHVDITHSSMTDENHAKNAITVMQAMHCWVRNTACRYYWHSAVMVQSSLYCTVRDSMGSSFAGIVTGERGYSFSAEGNSSHILFTGNAAYGGRHNYICNTGFTNSGVVFYDNDSHDSLASIEAHMHWSMGILFDNIRDYNASDPAAMGVYNRGNYGTNHGWACAHCVIWNSLQEKQNILCQKPPAAQNYVIGCTAGKLITGAKPPSPFSQPTGFVEGTNMAGLNPASLYLAQLAARNDCPLLPSSPTPTPTPTKTRTPSPSLTATPTRSFSPSSSPTSTVTPGQSATATLTRIPTLTQSPTFSASASPSHSVTPTLSRSPSPSLTATLTLTQSATATLGFSPVPSATPSLSFTPTLPETQSPSPTLSVTGSVTASGTRSSTHTASPTLSFSATATSSPTLTFSPSKTCSPGPSATLTPSPTPPSSPSPSVTLTPSAQASRTPRSSEGPLVIEQNSAAPNPFGGSELRIAYKTLSSADTVELRVYAASSLACVGNLTLPGPGSPGWYQATLGCAGWANGLYYYQLVLKKGERRSIASEGKALRLR